MADTEGPQIASAVLIPDEIPTQAQEDTPLPDAPTPASEPPAESVPQLSSITIDTAIEAPTQPQATTTSPPISKPQKRPSSRSASPPPKRTRRAPDDPRARNKRLFGSLLSTLSTSAATTNTSTQKRRASIEARQQEKLRAQAEEFDAQQRRERARLSERRREEQVVWEGWERSVRFEGMRGRASALRTRTLPILYYKPWELRPHEKEQIQRQVREVEEDIERELDELDDRREQELARQRVEDDREKDDRMSTEPMANTNGHDRVDGSNPEPNGVSHRGVSVEKDTRSRSLHIEPESSREVAEDNDEMVVEAGEDAVIY